MFVAGATREQKSFEGGLQRLEFFKNTTCEPCASFLLVMTFSYSYTLHDGRFFLQGVSLTVPWCFTWGVSLGLHTLYWFMCGAPLACPSAGLYGVFLLHAQSWFTCGLSLTHPMLASFSWEFLSSGLCWLLYVGNFFFTKQKEKCTSKQKCT